MKSYLIGYDLNKTVQDYTDLITAIKELSGTWWHHLDSTWVIKTDKTAVEIRNILKEHMDANDELLVAHLSGEARGKGLMIKGQNG